MINPSYFSLHFNNKNYFSKQNVVGRVVWSYISPTPVYFKMFNEV